MADRNKNDFIVPILINTALFNIFIFLRIFYSNFTFLASTIELAIYALPIGLLVFLLTKKQILKMHDPNNSNSKKATNFLVILTGLNIWLFFTGIFGVCNQVLDDSEEIKITLGIEAIEQKSHKRGISRVAIVTLPFNSGLGAIIPDAQVEIGVSKDDEKNFQLGNSKLHLTYKKGFFNIPWMVEKKFLP